MTTPEYGVTPQGFKAKRLIDVKNELEDAFIAEFGDINLDPQSVTGQLIGIYSKVLADIWENLQDVYLSQYPNSATGVSLDNVVQLNGITRLPAQRTFVIGAATGIPGTLIPIGSLARLTGTQNIFESTESVIISNGNSIQNIVSVNSTPQAQEYVVLINGTRYAYGLPSINFSAPIASGNAIDVRINGINIPTVPYSTSSAVTLTNLISAIVANSNGAVASGTVSGNSVRLVPTLGRQITINSVNVTGPGAITYTITFIAPATSSQVAENLSAILNGSVNVSSNWTSGNNFTIQAIDSNSPYSLNVGINLSISQTTTPINFRAQTFGPIPAPAGSLTEILTPIAGWAGLTNFQAGITGRFQETDEELRLRRLASLRVLGAATVEAIRSRLLQEVPGVSSVLVFENVTMTQDPLSVTFSSDFVSPNSAQVVVDGLIVGTVNFATTHLAMITAISNLLAAQPDIASAVVGGVGNRVINITFAEGETAEISFNIAGGVVPTYSESGGRPPKSFEAVVEGGSDAAVALKIWQVKPAGIQSFGNTSQVIVDSQGNNQTIYFSRAVPIYIWANVVLTLNPQETFPSNGQELVSNAILAYGNTLGIGVDVFIQRVQAAIFSVPGIASSTVQLARTLSPSDSPVYLTTDIDILDTEISRWDLSRIFVSI